ncbi:uncharacterized protein LACBIDRAFT_178467 [Laccaria bicolor S238N-H82]|uniref:Predicted protein n=1 Tax=Laccaria bicolor (strain S238N-H82 / ATCC MYA-4686) TaxID=486041 RepID=B0D459_LACBS|nr:uncharacterized protein LACBIDRAFT_178467 [Laccaria bicolor S238N-H82]EDR10275.1 predicted protein [Laccaria bicolor S238N-H82]|eukprot:XP_001878725.1 predicted protein [Laccaria bicolor S238N-H82]
MAASKVVFVGNVPYNMAEDQLIDVFKSVGQVIGFRLSYDRDTGKPKGYGFCEFADHETAMSAVRNLNGVDVGGRPLRIDLAESDPHLEGKTTVRGEIYPDAPPSSGWRGGGGGSSGRGFDPEAFLANLPPGVQIPKGSSSLDHISQTLATMQPSQLMEVLAQMKAFVITHPDQAKILLVKHPQFAYALFQALLLNKIVDQAILQRMLEATGAGAVGRGPPPPHAPPAARPLMPVPPPHLQHGHLPLPSHYPPSQMPPFPPQAAPVPPPMAPTTPQPPQQPQAQPAPEISDSQRTMLMQVLSLTQEQINALPDAERSAILQLRNQFMGGLGAA